MDRKEKELREDGQVVAEVVSEGRSRRTSGQLATESTALSSSVAGSPSKSALPPEPKAPPKIDALLQQGEELYSMGMYEHAIHVWTRILFLDKSDARAKRAIERGKRALGERQRVLDEELALATRLIEQGDLGAATATVRAVLSTDPRSSEGHQLVERIAARKRRPDAGQPLAPVHVETVEALPATKRGLLLRVSRKASPRDQGVATGSRLKMAGFALGTILVFASGALYLHLNWESIVSDGAFAAGSASVGGGAEPDAAYVPGPSELRYYNGARLFEKGRYREALAELTLVGRDGPVAERARGLILRIEQRLLRGATAPIGSSESPSSFDGAVEPTR